MPARDRAAPAALIRSRSSSVGWNSRHVTNRLDELSDTLPLIVEAFNDVRARLTKTILALVGSHSGTLMKTVLIIDDNPVITNIYRGKLSAGGLHTEIASNGEEGLEMLDRCKPDVVLLDLMLPKVNGMDVLKRIRARAEYKTLPVVVFSNSYSTDVMQQAWGFGATDVLHKSSTTPQNVVLALVRAIANSAASSTPAVAPSVATEAPSSPESQMPTLLQRLATGRLARRARILYGWFARRASQSRSPNRW